MAEVIQSHHTQINDEKATLDVFLFKAKEQHASDNGKNLPNLLMFAVLSKISDYFKADENKKHTVIIKKILMSHRNEEIIKIIRDKHM